MPLAMPVLQRWEDGPRGLLVSSIPALGLVWLWAWCGCPPKHTGSQNPGSVRLLLPSLLTAALGSRWKLEEAEGERSSQVSLPGGPQ